MLNFIGIALMLQCATHETPTEMNRLSASESPYLLQHQHNPVHWQPWDEQALAEASAQDKLLLISIGYSSCHWCHVMEHESFEDDSVAAVMNEHFVCIKVDREERPDIDQVYMSAVQIMSGQGGWPLNCVALPDGRPVWGGTYFPKDQWKHSLQQLANLYQSDRGKMEEYARRLQEGMQESEAIIDQTDDYLPLQAEVLENALVNWRRRMDTVWGGPDKAPKFPLPNNLELLLHLHQSEQWPWLEEHLRLTLNKMAMGGIYDQIGGGFARYSTDKEWKVPHFEKMLYDNAQLIHLYSQAFLSLGDSMYLRIAEECLDWMQREMRADNGLYFSALDADSEGEEGLFYTWSASELEGLQQNLPEISLHEWFKLAPGEEWEGRFLLQRQQTDGQMKAILSDAVFQEQWAAIQSTLLQSRSKRIRPGLDYKLLTSWNALAISGIGKLYEASHKEEYRELAVAVFESLRSTMLLNERLHHAAIDQKAYGEALLDDYAFFIRAAIDLHRISGKEAYLQQALEWTEEALRLFDDPNSALLWYSTDRTLVVRTKENEDNVIPAANSQMARNLYDLGLLFGRPEWMQRSKDMLLKVLNGLERYPEGYSNWGVLLHFLVGQHYELAIVGKDAEREYHEILQHLPERVLLVWSESPSDLPIFQGRWVDGKTLYYLCQEGACQMPQSNWHEVVNLLEAHQ